MESEKQNGVDGGKTKTNMSVGSDFCSGFAGLNHMTKVSFMLFPLQWCSYVVLTLIYVLGQKQRL